MTQQNETALNITVGMEVALAHVGSWDISYTKYTVAKVLKNNRFRLKAANGVISDVIWKAVECQPNYAFGNRKAPAHVWEAKCNHEYYKRDFVVPWDASVEQSIAAKKQMHERKAQISKIQERVSKLHHTQHALIERLLAALGGE